MLQALRRFTSALVRRRRERAAYARWIALNEGAPPAAPSSGPRVSVIVTAGEPGALMRTIVSLCAQTYANWEALVPAAPEALPAFEDIRLRAIGGSSGTPSLQACLNAAAGTYAAIVRCGDTLAPYALARCVDKLTRTRAVLVYTDEDRVDEHARRFDPFFKPGWCPDSFLSRNYVAGLAVFDRAVALACGGFRRAFADAQEYDLLLRLSERTQAIEHIPAVLYHRARHAADLHAHALAVDSALQRRSETGTVHPVPNLECALSVRYTLRNAGKASIVIPTRDRADMLSDCLNSVFSKSTYSNFEVLVVDNGSKEAATLALFDDWRVREPNRFRILSDPRPFNYAALNNRASAAARGDYLVFLNNDTEIITPDWLEALMEQAQRTSIGAAGAMLLYADGTLQHAGVILGVSNGIATHSHYRMPSDEAGYFGQVQTINNYCAVTAACMMIRRTVFEQAGGFDERLAVSWNDVDLCLRLMSAGYRNVYLPHVRLYHYESKTRAGDRALENPEVDRAEREIMQSRWAALIEDDPCYSPNLSREFPDYRIRA